MRACIFDACNKKKEKIRFLHLKKYKETKQSKMKAQIITLSENFSSCTVHANKVQLLLLRRAENIKKKKKL
jgi:hypothetical protein